MRKYLLVALLVAGCSQEEPVVRADRVEIIHVDTQTVMINMTVSSNGERTTIAFTPAAALQAQAELGRTIALVMQGAEQQHVQPPAIPARQ